VIPLLLALAAAPPPDLGPVRYRDPQERRELWLGADVGGVAIPRRLGLFDRRVWTVRTSGAWALALTPWLAAGGRHGLAWYDATGNTSSTRLRMHEHSFALSGRPMVKFTRMRDRLALGVDFHSVEHITVGETDLRVGGVKDAILGLGYGIEHDLGARWTLGWRVQLRHAWVFLDKQRQVRASAKATFRPRPPHALSLEAIGYYVNRDEDPFGAPHPRNSAHGQFACEYAWLSRVGVGIAARARFATNFLSGEAPIYEIQEEAMDNVYGDLTVGLRAVWR
jgi:hypothetical protein